MSNPIFRLCAHVVETGPAECILRNSKNVMLAGVFVVWTVVGYDVINVFSGLHSYSYIMFGWVSVARVREACGM